MQKFSVNTIYSSCVTKPEYSVQCSALKCEISCVSKIINNSLTSS